MAWSATENFDSYSAGTELTGSGGTGWSAAWARYNGTGTITNETAPAWMTSIAARHNATAGASYRRSLTTAVTVGTVRFVMSISTTTPSDFAGVILQDTSAGKMYCKFGTTDIQVFNNDTGVYESVFAGYSVDTAYTIDFDFDNVAQANKYRVRVNNGTYSAWKTVNGGTYTSITQFAIDASLTNNPHTFWAEAIAATPFVPATGKSYLLQEDGTYLLQENGDGILLEQQDIIEFDAASNSSYQAAASSYSWNHTCTGNSRYLSVGISMLSLAQSVSSITYNSVNLSLIGVKASVSGAARIELWGLAAPSAGTNSIAVTLTGAIASAGNASSYTGVHQTSPTEAFNSAQATNVGAADATVDVTTVADNDWCVDIVATDDTAITVGAGQTQTGNVTGAGGSGAMSYEGPKTPAGAVTMSWTNVAALATWAIGSVALRPVVASSLGSRQSQFTLLGVS